MRLIACTVSEFSCQLVHKRSLILVSSFCTNNLLIMWSVWGNLKGSDQTVGDALTNLNLAFCA